LISKFIETKDGVVVICTYSMLSYTRERSAKSLVLWNFIVNNDWGLMLLDEVQVAPAEKFS